MPDITELRDPEAEVQCLSGDDGPSADYPTRPVYWKSPRRLGAGSVVPRPRGHLDAPFLGSLREGPELAHFWYPCPAQGKALG